MTYHAQFLPCDGRSPYYREIVASSEEEALSLATDIASDNTDGIYIEELVSVSEATAFTFCTSCGGECPTITGHNHCIECEVHEAFLYNEECGDL